MQLAVTGAFFPARACPRVVYVVTVHRTCRHGLVPHRHQLSEHATVQSGLSSSRLARHRAAPRVCHITWRPAPESRPADLNSGTSRLHADTGWQNGPARRTATERQRTTHVRLAKSHATEWRRQDIVQIANGPTNIDQTKAREPFRHGHSQTQYGVKQTADTTQATFY